MEATLSTKGDAVGQRWTFDGADMGGSATLGTPPTGKRVTMVGTSVYHLKNGRIADELMTEDALGLVRQL